MNIHEWLCITVYEEAKVKIQFHTTLDKIGQLQEVGHCQLVINIVTSNLKLAC